MIGLLDTLARAATGWILEFDDALDGAWDLSDHLLRDDSPALEDHRPGARP